MEQQSATYGFMDTYRLYAGLMRAIGHEVDQVALAEHLGEEESERRALKTLLSDAAGREDGRSEVQQKAAARLMDMAQGLVEEIASAAGGWSGEDTAKIGAEELVQRLHEAPDGRKEAIADAVLLNGHRKVLLERYVAAEEVVGEFRKRQNGAKLDLQKLVSHVEEELGKRGYPMSQAAVRKLLSGSYEGQRVPYCLKHILERLDGRFVTSLVPLTAVVGDRDATEWLEETRRKLLFRSHSAMHQAIARATGLKYDCVHKALSGRRKAKRIQAQIKYFLDRWLEDVGSGREPDVSDEYRGVPVGQTQAMLPALEKRLGTRERVYRAISQRTGIRAGSVRRYFQGNGQLRYAPLSVLKCVEEIIRGGGCAVRMRSYLADVHTRSVAFELARRANEALARWRETGGDGEEEMTYRELRLVLIETMKEQRASLPVGV
jgi:hypothetical protein